jgi:hypothetical protein
VGDATTASCEDCARRLAIGPRILESIRFRPRVRERERERDESTSRSSHSSGFSQVHGGWLGPEGNPSAQTLFGFRGGTSIDDRIQLGVNVDWVHKFDRTAQVVSQEPLPTGGTAERKIELSRSSSNLFPVMALLQVSPGGDLPFTPYFGIAGGYEVLFLAAEDFQTGDKFDATFGGWGWQAWGGAMVPLSPRARLLGEVYVNNAEAGRDVKDDASGLTYHEVVTLNGVGMRFGLNWGF